MACICLEDLVALNFYICMSVLLCIFHGVKRVRGTTIYLLLV